MSEQAKFNIGDRVVTTKNSDFLPKGMEGTICYEYSYWKKRSQVMYAVEILDTGSSYRSTCDGYDEQMKYTPRVPSGHGFWIYQSYLEIAGPPRDGLDNWE